jgi:hypothetical protein
MTRNPKTACSSGLFISLSSRMLLLNNFSVYSPAVITNFLPAIVWIHGGG